MLVYLITILYLIGALLLTLYTSGQLLLLLVYWRTYRQQPRAPEPLDWPSVAIQLPIYNEQHVVPRLLESMMRLDYPRERLHIQILDDSTDETSRIIARYVEVMRQQGLSVSHMQRHERVGYKAGALAYGLSLLHSDLIALFDADFVPPPDFLRRTVPFFCHDPQLGIVQTRWGHLNPQENALTMAQALSIDVHFVIEQRARNRVGWPLSFNGTGGIWRTACIHAAGGWSSATLTEDLDLSYRAQLGGWRYLLLPDVVVPGEVPPQLAAYKQQQARWAKGNIQCLARLIAPVWRSKRLSGMAKAMATHLLCQYLVHPLMFLLLLLTPPLMLDGALQRLPLAPLGLISLAPPLLFLVSQRQLYADWPRRLLAFPIVLLLGAGMTWNNTLAAFSVLVGRGGGFQRTPKFNSGWRHSAYALSTRGTPWGETLLALYSLWAVGLALVHNPAIAPYLAVYAGGYGLLAVWGWRDQRYIRRIIRPSARLPKQS